MFISMMALAASSDEECTTGEKTFKNHFGRNTLWLPWCPVVEGGSPSAVGSAFDAATGAVSVVRRERKGKCVGRPVGGARHASPLPTYDVGAMDAPEAAALPAWAHGRDAWRPLGPRSSNCSSLAGRPDLSRWHRVLRRLGDGSARSLDVLVLGGSLAAGRMEAPTATWAPSECPAWQFSRNPTHRDNRPCAFAARLGTWLSRAYAGVAVDVTNWAIGGSPSSAALRQLGPELADGRRFDVAFLHYADNDAAQQVKAWPFGILLRLLLRRGTAVVVVETHQPNPGLAAYGGHAAACRSLGVPMMAWTAASLHQTQGRHPPWPGQQLIADWLAHEWRLQAGRAAAGDDGDGGGGGGVAPTVDVPASEVICLGASFLYDAAVLGRGKASCDRPGCDRVRERGWRLAEDRPNTWGWLGNASSGALEFQVPADTAVVVIGFLQSYAPAMAKVAAYYAGRKEHAVLLNARETRSRVSQTAYRRLCAPAPGNPDFPACDAPARPLHFHRSQNTSTTSPGAGSSGVKIPPKNAALLGIANRLAAPTRAIVFEFVSGQRFALRYVTAC